MNKPIFLDKFPSELYDQIKIRCIEKKMLISEFFTIAAKHELAVKKTKFAHECREK
jgi:hypothetical protein